MAQRTSKSEILRLKAQSAAARVTLKGEVDRLRHKLDVPARVKQSVKGSPVRWVLGTTATGLASALLLPRVLARKKRKKKPEKVEKNRCKDRVTELAWSVARPVLRTYLTKQLQAWLIQQGQRAIHTQPAKPQIH